MKNKEQALEKGRGPSDHAGLPLGKAGQGRCLMSAQFQEGFGQAVGMSLRQSHCWRGPVSCIRTPPGKVIGWEHPWEPGPWHEHTGAH